MQKGRRRIGSGLIQMIKTDKSIRHIRIILAQQTSLVSVLLRISCLLLRVVMFDSSTSIWMMSSSQFLSDLGHTFIWNKTVPLRVAKEMYEFCCFLFFIFFPYGIIGAICVSARLELKGIIGLLHWYRWILSRVGSLRTSVDIPTRDNIHRYQRDNPFII